MVVLAIHVVDGAVRGQDILGRATGPLAPLLTLGVLAAAVAVFMRRGPGVRTLLAAALGLVATFVGVGVPVSQSIVAGPADSDYSGVLATLAGLDGGLVRALGMALAAIMVSGCVLAGLATIGLLLPAA